MKDKARGFIGWTWEPRLGVTVSRREWGLGISYVFETFSLWLGPLRIWIEPGAAGGW